MSERSVCLGAFDSPERLNRNEKSSMYRVRIVVCTSSSISVFRNYSLSLEGKNISKERRKWES